MQLRCLPLQHWNQLALSGGILRNRPPARVWRRTAATMSSSGGGTSSNAQLLSVAPMMDWTDVHYRQLARLLSRHTWLYTEMVVDQTLIHNPNRDRFLAFPPEQHPIVCQLGGSDPVKLAAAAKIVAEYGYDEINLNCGCPSDRVAGAGCFGAALMLQPQLVADCCAAVAQAVAECGSANGGPPPITVKCRLGVLGVDDCDSYEELCRFIRTVSEGSPVTHFVIHARKCHLKGLNPHQNRTVPPLRYEWVWALKRDFPHLEFSLNGGVQGLAEAVAALHLVNSPDGGASPAAPSAKAAVSSNGAAAAGENGSTAAAAAAGDANCAEGSSGDGGVPAAAPVLPELAGAITGVMIGRAAYNIPWDTLADADRAIFGAASNPAKSRRQVLEEYAAYADGVLERFKAAPPADGWRGPSLRTLVKPLLGMFHNEPRGKKWRNAVDTAFRTCTTVSGLLEATLPVLKPETLDAPPKPTPLRRDLKLQHFATELPPAWSGVEAVPQPKRVKTA